MIKKIARWILRDELTPKILPPSKVMMTLKHIFYQEDKDAGMAYAMAIRIMELYKADYERCIGTCEDIRNDLEAIAAAKCKEKE